MIVCTNCGNHNEDSDEFCGSCGKFLAWVGEKIAAPPPPEPVVEEAEPDTTKTGFVDRVKAAVGIDEASRHDAPVGVGVGGPGSLPEAPEQDEAAAALEAAAAEAAAAETARQEAEAAEAARRAAAAQQEAEARAAEQAESARRAEEEARVRAEEEAKAKVEAEARRTAQLEAEAKAREEAEARRAAEEEAARQAEQARLAQIEAERASATAAERAAAEAEAARQAEQAREAQAAADAAKRAEEEAKAAAEAEAAARAEAEAKARAEAEARKAAEEEARLRAEDEARALAAAEARAKEEEEARKRAAALLARPKAPATPPVDATPKPDPFVTPPAEPAVAAASGGAATVPHAQKPTAQHPVAQQPSAVKQPPRPDPKVTAAEKVVNAGDLVCSQCGQGNDPARKFCRKCGNSLAAAVVAKKVPWWKKLFGGKKVRTSKEAGDREKKKQKARDASFRAQMLVVNARKVLMVLAMFGLAGSLAIPSVRVEGMRIAKGGLGSVQEIFNPQIAPVNAVGVSASSAVPGKEANFAADLVLNSFWAEGAEGDGIGQTISFTFAEPTDLTKVIITAGSTAEPEAYLNNPRPKELHVVFDNGGSTDITLIDAEFRKSQSFNLKGAKGVSKVDISISSVYPGRGGTETGIAEVEFKKKG